MIGVWTVGFAIGLLLLLLVPVRLEVTYRRLGVDDNLWLKIELAGGWGSWQLEVKSVQTWWQQGPCLNLETLFPKNGADRSRQGKVEVRRLWTGFRTFKRAFCSVALHYRYWWHIFKKVLRIWQCFLASVSCHRWRLLLSLGTGEPASTALTYGSTWLLLSRLYRNLRQQARLDFQRPELEVKPLFNFPGWQVDFNCIFSFRLGYIISAGLRFSWLILISMWQMKGSNKSARTPYRNLDEDGNGKHQRYG